MHAPPSASSDRRLRLLCIVLLAVATCWNCREVLRFDFVAMDDDINIYFNPHLGPPTAGNLYWMVTDTAYLRRYIPMSWLALSATYGLSGLSPVGYHAANLALHVANSILLYLLLLQMGRRWGPAADENWLSLGALIGAALWSLHPMRAETVGWASGLLYGAAGFFALLSVMAYLRTHAADVSRGARQGWLATAAAMFAASMLAYPMTAGLAGVFVLIDLAVLNALPSAWRWGDERVRRLAGEKLLLLLPAMAVAACTVFASYQAKSYWPAPPALQEFGLLARMAQALCVWADYLWRPWWPVGLTPAPTTLLDFDPLAMRFVMSATVVVGLSGVLLGLPRWRRGAGLFWLGYLALLAPMTGFFEHPHFAPDRYGYLSAMLVSAGLLILFLRTAGRWRVFSLCCAGAVAVALAGMQQRQLRYWQDTDTLFARMMATTDSVRFKADRYEKWARFHLQRGELDAAQAVVGDAERVPGLRTAFAPRSAEVKREVQAARANTAASPLAALLHTKMAMDLSREGRFREARDHGEAALQLAPGGRDGLYNVAIVCALAGEGARALHLYLCATAPGRASPPDVHAPQVLALIAEAFFAEGNADAACRAILAARDRAASEAERASLERRLARYRSAKGGRLSAAD